MAHPAVRVAALAALAAALAGALTVTAGAGVPEWVFGSVTTFALLLVLDHGVRSWRVAGRERRRARTVLGVAPEAAARDAVVDERRRLAADIAAGLRESLTAIGDWASAAVAAADPVPAIGDIHREARRATADLRRHLGLLRDPPPDVAPAPEPDPAPRVPNAPDLLIAAAVTVLALVEAIAYPLLEGTSRSWLSVVLTSLAAAAIVGRRTAPGPAALVVGLTFLVALAFDAPVSSGFWCLATIGGLLWTIAVRSTSTRRDAACAGLLLLAAGASAWLLDPDNAALLVLTMIVALAGGGTVRFARSRTDVARARARRHEDEIGAATAAALAVERTAFAREIHDTVSHAVGLIAVQAAAAEVSWPGHPAATRQALGVIAATTTAALADLDRSSPRRPPRPRRPGDLVELIDRIRAAGTTVRVAGLDLVPPARLDVTYRMLQESLTNVLRHGGGATAQVTITVDDDLRIVVDDDGSADGPGDPPARRGYGLIGLAERVGFAGGTLRAGPGPGGGYRVEVTLPAVVDRVAT
ncbi:MAG TPA: histidine kinase [Nakamurella multipartita]|nr:histidine kinase [Nakamurella multipartita]